MQLVRLFYFMKSHFGFERWVEGAFAYSVFATCYLLLINFDFSLSFGWELFCEPITKSQENAQTFFLLFFSLFISVFVWVGLRNLACQTISFHFWLMIIYS